MEYRGYIIIINGILIIRLEKHNSDFNLVKIK